MKNFTTLLLCTIIAIMTAGLFYKIPQLLLASAIVLYTLFGFLICAFFYFVKEKFFLQKLKEELKKQTPFEVFLEQAIRVALIILSLAHGWYVFTVLYLVYLYMTYYVKEKVKKA